ncbi:MAG: hypothetical protein QW505_02355 [Thermoplasmata archaeon]
MKGSPNFIAAKLEAVLKSRCDFAGQGEADRVLDSITRFFESLEGKRLSKLELLRRAAEVVRKAFGFEEVTVLTECEDGLFRYNVVIGYTEKAEMELRSLAYRGDQVLEPDSTPLVKINKYMDLTIAEAEQRPDQKVGYTHPVLISMPRKNLEEFVYGDYLDVYVFGSGDRILAVFELSAPRDGKMPSATKLKWLRLFAIILGNVIEHQTD